MNIKNEVFFNENFIPAFKKLLTFDLESTVTIRLIKSIKILDEQQYALHLTKDKFLDQLSARKIDGEVVFDTIEHKLKFENKLNDLLKDEFAIPIEEKIKLTKAHKISGQHLGALLDIVEVIDDDDNGGK